MNPTTPSRPRWYVRPWLWWTLLPLELVGGWFWLNAQVVRGPTPAAAASAELAFEGHGAETSGLRWEPVGPPAPGVNFGRRVELVGYHEGRRVARVRLNSFLWLGWQAESYQDEREPGDPQPRA